MSKIKPLIISRTLPYLGGREVVVNILIKSFSKNGDLCVLTPDNYPKQGKVKKYNSNRDYADILKWVKKQKVTIINCHTFYLADLAIYLSRELNKPLVFTLHGVFIDFYGRKYGKLLKNIYNNSNRIITVSDNYRYNLGKYIGDSSKLITIKNGIDLKVIDKINKNPLYYRKKNHLPEEKFIVLIPARLTYLKGLDYLVEAAKNINDKGILFIVCSPKGRKNFEETVYRNKLKNLLQGNLFNVKFIYLDQDKILEYYQSSNVILLPSLIEGVSISLLEAMALGKTVVATKIGGNREIITHKRNGYIINPKNSKAIKKIILTLKRQRKPLITGKYARQTIVNHFLSDTMVDGYYKIFKEIINENK
ncbi:MAG: glycosyltransferase family 4 protein [Candidatus Zambryskibacteria bacterium]|nr:glycosyltransferase family 4 protein [Candidatus Zambryskibacteria bacterium]